MHQDRQESKPRSLSSGDVPSLPPTRRDFLKLAGATTAAIGMAPFLTPPRKAAAQQPHAVKVLVEDLRLDPPGLAQGTLEGLAETPNGLLLTSPSGRGQLASPVLTARNAFTHIGLHWTAVGDVSFEVRSSMDGAAWSDWEPVLADDHGASGGAETFGALVSADRATRVQFRARFERGRAAPLLQSATVTLLNAKDGPTTVSLAAAPPAPPLTTGGAVYTREQWGCDESLRNDNNGNELWPPMYVPVKKAFVHHTVTSTSNSSVEDAMADVRAVHTYHAKTQGWGDIGYNALVDKFGNIYEGRYGRGAGGAREVFSPGVVAGHTLKHNYGTTSVAALWTATKKGDAGQPGLPPTDAMKTAIVDYLAWECDRHDIDPSVVSNFLLISDEVNDAVHNISGHRDGYPFSSTVCPGGYLYELLPQMRTAVASKLNRGAPSVALTAPSPSVQAVPLGAVESQTFSWESSTGQFRYLLEGWRRQTPESEAIDYVSGADSTRYPAWQTTTQTSATFGTLFDAFASAGFPEPVPGHYTLHLVPVGADGRLGYAREHTLLVTPGGAAPPPAGTIALTANGYRVKNSRRVDLTWSGATTAEVLIRRRRNGGSWSTVAQVANDNEPAGSANTYTDNLGTKASGTYTYQVTEVGTARASNEASVTF